MTLRFAALGIDHFHIFDHISGLIDAGAEFAGFAELGGSPRIIEGVRKTWPGVPVLTAEQILADESIAVVCNASIPSDGAKMAIEAMRHGKDVMIDKPGATTHAQLDELRSVVAETGRIFSICFSERLAVRSAERAGRLVAEGAIGRVVQTLGIGPHRLNRRIRPDWFFDPDRYGGILTDIASHQIDQFLFYTGSTSGEIVASTVGNYGNPADPGLQDFGQMLLQSDRATGYVRVDWFTPDALPTWGDGRLMILGTEGYIELRKYVDVAGRPGGDHLFLVNGTRAEHIDCSGDTLSYFANFIADVQDRTETAMPQAHVFEVSRLAIEAQLRATILTPQENRA
jgi:predicted dehydrogenase